MSGPGEVPLVTVVIATFNCAGMLRWALESVRGQDFPSFEVWVVGDGCRDDSENAVSALGDPRFRWRNLDRNSGTQAAPNNEALRQARGKYVAYLGHDDLWFPWHLSTLVRAIEETRSDLVHSLCALVGPAGAVEATGPPKAGVSYESHFVPPSSWLHRTQLCDDCGFWGISDQLPLAVDREYLRRLHRAGKTIEFVPQLTALKFPSMWWRHYAPSQVWPQRAYLEKMTSEPAELERRVLLELSIEFARERYGGDEPLIRPVKRSLRLLARTLVRIWGPDRWPMSTLLSWNYQRYRRSIRVARGLK